MVVFVCGLVLSCLAMSGEDRTRQGQVRQEKAGTQATADKVREV